MNGFPTFVLELVMVVFVVDLLVVFVVARRARLEHGDATAALPWRYEVADDLRQPYAKIVEAARYDVIAELMPPPEPKLYDAVVATSRSFVFTQVEIDAARRRLESSGWWSCRHCGTWNSPHNRSWRHVCIHCGKRPRTRIVRVSLASPPPSGVGRYTSDVERTEERTRSCPECREPVGCSCYDDLRSLLP
jgi:hypothetical protein